MRPSSLFHLRSLKSRLAVWVFLPSILIIAIDLVVSFRSSEQIATLVQQQLLHGAAAMISEQLTLSEDEYEISVPPAAFELLPVEQRARVDQIPPPAAASSIVLIRTAEAATRRHPIEDLPLGASEIIVAICDLIGELGA